MFRKRPSGQCIQRGAPVRSCIASSKGFRIPAAGHHCFIISPPAPAASYIRYPPAVTTREQEATIKTARCDNETSSPPSPIFLQSHSTTGTLPFDFQENVVPLLSSLVHWSAASLHWSAASHNFPPVLMSALQKGHLNVRGTWVIAVIGATPLKEQLKFPGSFSVLF
ncbi:expressed unknown protein [Seminavis robusta]|uniref:Uncharacterized protein n=1 Tax=Seminavis robusta TaxID=568900 RepID=A0A9N8HK68_9STRA|nr:expressed unknown protein [Seminavis robusta]|eukprot:Sro918_g219991.1  (167) ;mRNA; f:7634-8134